MSHPAASSDDEFLVDPDHFDLPEHALHGRTVDLLAHAAGEVLGPQAWVLRRLTWYPEDGGDAVAPDIVVLPRTALDGPPRSYRQDQTGGPAPVAVVEVASETDTFAALLARARRYRRLGAPTYVVVLGDEPDVLRLGPDDPDLVVWTGRSIPELGGISLGFNGGVAELILPDGTTTTGDAELMAAARAEAAAARTEARDAEDRARAAEGRVDALLERLRDLEAELGPDDEDRPA